MCVRACVRECAALHMHIVKSSRCINQLPQPLALVDPFTTLPRKFSGRLLYFGGVLVFLGRPLNDHRLAASQAQTSLSIHSLGLNRCQYSHNTLSVPICQPRIVGQHSTVQLTSAIVKLTYANFLSFLPVFFFSFQGKGLNMEQQGKMPCSWAQ